MNLENLCQIAFFILLLINFLLCLYILSLRDTKIKNDQTIKAQAREIGSIKDTNFYLDNAVVELKRQLDASVMYTTKPVEGRTQIISFSIDRKSVDLLDERCVGEDAYPSRAALLRATVAKFLETPK